MLNKPLSRKVSVSDIEAHPTEDAIVVTYKLEASLVGDLGDPVVEEKKECQKIIRLKSLEQATDIEILALETIKKSNKLISYSQIDEVRQILAYLISRKEKSASKIENLRPKTAASSRPVIEKQTSDEPEECSALLDREFCQEMSFSNYSEARINKIDEYIEKLYEEVPVKIKGAGMILKLSQSDENLAEMTNNETLLCALARVLREEGKKCLELSTLILATFATFSNYKNFHDVIVRYKIGSLTLDLIAREIMKESELFEELSSRQSSAGSSVSSSSISESVKSSNGVKEKTIKKYKQFMIRQNLMLKMSFVLLYNLCEDPKLEPKIVKKGIVGHLVKSLERESNSEFVPLILKFLLKLSIYGENKDTMAEMAIIEKLFIIFSSKVSKSGEEDPQFVTNILNLVFNLSFDPKLSQNMSSVGFVQKLLIYWCKYKSPTKKSFEQLILRILYQVSREESNRSCFSFNTSPGTDSIDLLMNKLFRTLDLNVSNGRPATSRYPRSLCVSEILVLLVNLALNEQLALKIAANGRISTLLVFIFDGRDLRTQNTILVLKFLRNLSIHDHKIIKTQFVPFVEQFLKFIFESGFKNQEKKQEKRLTAKDVMAEDVQQTILTESLGILGSLNDNELKINWFGMISDLNGFQVLFQVLESTNSTEDDVLLEVIIFLGTACGQEQVAEHFVTNKGLDLCSKVLSAKQEDDEIVLQTVFLIHQVVIHKVLKDQITSNAQLSNILLELMNDKNFEVKKLSSETLDIVSSTHQVWGNKVKIETFRNHNQQWLHMMTDGPMNDDDDHFGDLNDEDESDEDDYDNLVLRPELLNSSLDSLLDSTSQSPQDSTDGHRSRQGQTRPTTGYGRR